MIKPTSEASHVSKHFSAAPSITSGDLPEFVLEAMENVIEFYRKPAAQQAAAEDFAAIELRVSDVVKVTGRQMLRGIIENRVDGSARLEPDGKPSPGNGLSRRARKP